MTLANTALQKLSEWQPAGPGPHTLVFTDAETGTGVRLSVEVLDRLAVALWEAEVVPGKAPARTLADQANHIAGRVTGFMEPLKVLEVDPARGQALLRSVEPARRESDRLYYEVLLNADGRAAVRRYQGSLDKTGRQQIAFTLTREAVAKLVGDLAG
jgi:hypothetical protein